MVKYLLSLFLITLQVNFSFAQTTAKKFSSVTIVDGSSLEKVIYNNRNKGVSAFHNIKVLYTITTSSVKVSQQELIDLITAIKKIDGVIDCFFDAPNFTLFVKTEKEINYVRIELIKAVMKENSKLQIENYKEDLYTID